MTYRKGADTKTIFTKLASEGRHIGEWNDYPHLELRLSESNFPDDGRKTVVREGERWRVRYVPREHCRGARDLRLCMVLPAHFSLPDRVLVDGRPVDVATGGTFAGVRSLAVEDAGHVFDFEPVDARGSWECCCVAASSRWSGAATSPSTSSRGSFRSACRSGARRGAEVLLAGP